MNRKKLKMKILAITQNKAKKNLSTTIVSSGVLQIFEIDVALKKYHNSSSG